MSGALIAALKRCATQNREKGQQQVPPLRRRVRSDSGRNDRDCGRGGPPLGSTIKIKSSGKSGRSTTGILRSGILLQSFDHGVVEFGANLFDGLIGAVRPGAVG